MLVTPFFAVLVWSCRAAAVADSRLLFQRLCCRLLRSGQTPGYLLKAVQVRIRMISSYFLLKGEAAQIATFVGYSKKESGRKGRFLNTYGRYFGAGVVVGEDFLCFFPPLCFLPLFLPLAAVVAVLVSVLAGAVPVPACANARLAPTNIVNTNVNNFFMDAPLKGSTECIDNNPSREK